MKLIQVVGRSNSGKTTFITRLIPALMKNGTVGAVKHLGHHDYHLEENKDTTLFYHAGAGAVAGIDSQKSVISFRDPSLETTLDMLAGQNLDFVVIEGFKNYPFPKIVMGSLAIDNCIMRDPEIADVIHSLNLFAEYPQCMEKIKVDHNAATKD